MAARAAVAAAGFVVSLELRPSAVTQVADVVLPVASVAEKAGSFLNWEGRVRAFPQVLESNAIPDVRALAGIAEELGRPLGFQTTQGARAELDEIGGWDGARVADPDVAPLPAQESGDGLRLATWKTMIGDGPMQDGDAAYHASGSLAGRPGERDDARVASASRWAPRSSSPPRPARRSSRPGSPTSPTTSCGPPAASAASTSPVTSGPSPAPRSRSDRPGRRAGEGSAGMTASQMVRTADDLSAFGNDALWVVLLKAVFIFVVLVLLTLFNIWWERRVVARMQHRIGPNVHGPFGLLQSLADGVKLALKEDITPKAADKVVFILAPIIAVIPAFVAWAVIPLGPEVRIPFTDTVTSLQLTDMPVAVLFVLAVASIGIYGIVLGGWSSGSTYSLLGGLRSSAQMISYEVAMGLALIAVFIYAGSLSTSEIVSAQESVWYAFILLPSFVIYVISMVGETNRAPFDLPEAEGELVGGFHTEYSSLKFALFFLAEYINMATVSALATTLFLGGWRAPWPISMWDGANEGYWPLVWFMGKVLCSSSSSSGSAARCPGSATTSSWTSAGSG